MLTDNLFDTISQFQRQECCNKKLNDYPASDFLKITINDTVNPLQYLLFDISIPKEEKTFPYCYWFSNRELIAFLSVDRIIDCKIESYTINQAINKNLLYLWHSRKNYYDYIMRWCYLILAQLSKNFNRTVFCKCKNSQEILITIQSMVLELSNNPSVTNDDLFESTLNSRTWILPSGMLYNSTNIPIEIEKLEQLYFWIYNEISSVKANYRMCIIDERQHDEVFDMVL